MKLARVVEAKRERFFPKQLVKRGREFSDIVEVICNC